MGAGSFFLATEGGPGTDAGCLVDIQVRLSSDVLTANIPPCANWVSSVPVLRTSPQIALTLGRATWTLLRPPGSRKRPRRPYDQRLPTIILTQRADFASVRPSRNTTKKTLVGALTLRRKFSSPAGPTKVSCAHLGDSAKPN